MYLMTATRPDLAYLIGLIARFMANPSLIYRKALNRIWQYIAYSADFKLTYKSNPISSDTLSGYCDSDWGGISVLENRQPVIYSYLGIVLFPGAQDCKKRSPYRHANQNIWP
jgi:hypothetical protein